MKIILLLASALAIGSTTGCPTCIGRITAETPVFFSPEADHHFGICVQNEPNAEQEIALENNCQPQEVV